MNINVRKAKKEDAQECIELCKSLIGQPGCTWHEKYPTREIIEEDIKNEDAYVICEDEKIISYGTIEDAHYMENVADYDNSLIPRCAIGRIAVAKEVQGRGVGRLIVKTLLDEIKIRGYKGVRLLTGYDNTGAIKLYENLGFIYRGEVVLFGTHWKCYDIKL